MLRRRRCLLGIIAAVSFGRRFESYRNGHVYVLREAGGLQTGKRKTAASASLCSRDQILGGSWEPTSLPRTPYVPTSRPFHGRCYRSSGGRGINLSLSAEPFPSYDWVVSSHGSNTNTNDGKACTLSEWSAEAFCSALRNRTLAFVGDSMTELQYYSLGYLLGHQPRRPMPHREWKYQSHQVICGGTSSMYWRGDPHLMALPGVIAEKQPDIVIINRGAHYQSDEETVAGLNGTVIPALREWLRGGNCTRRARAEKDRRCRLFFRTTTPGHPRCGRHTRPLRPGSEEVAAMEAAIRNESAYRREGDFNTYHWQDFRHQNHLQERVLAESGLEFTVLDVYDIMLLRPDLHSDGEPGGNDTDCLHYCLPGPLDLLNRLLLHELLREQVE